MINCKLCGADICKFKKDFRVSGGIAIEINDYDNESKENSHSQEEMA